MSNGESVFIGKQARRNRSKSRIIMTDQERVENEERLPPVHPGEVLLEDFMKPLGLSQYRLAQDLGVPALRISQIVHGKRAVTADTALRLARYFGTSANVWMRLQARYDLEVAEVELAERVKREGKSPPASDTCIGITRANTNEAVRLVDDEFGPDTDTAAHCRTNAGNPIFARPLDAPTGRHVADGGCPRHLGFGPARRAGNQCLDR